MRLSLRRITIRILTSAGTFGADLPFNDGLNIIRGENSVGKSTCMMTINYCLGLEGMLSPTRRPPFPYSMSSVVADEKGAEHNVVQSYTEIEIENQKAQKIQIRRFVHGGPRPNLVNVRQRAGDALWPDGVERDFYVNLSGSAQREAGFHAFLSSFIGWTLPEVHDFEGRRLPLYIETLFPFFFIEQKAGWSTVQGPFPTYFRIQDLPRRATEFVLDLNIQRARLRLRDAEDEIANQRRLWSDGRRAINQLVRSQLGRVSGVPSDPTMEFTASDDVTIEVLPADKWQPLGEAIAASQIELEQIQKVDVPTADAAAASLEAELLAVTEKYHALQIETDELQGVRNDHHIQLQATRQRLSALREDLAKHRDARRLKELGSALGSIVSTGLCPTCQQAVDHELLPPESTHVMTVDEGIEFIQSQILLFDAAHRSIVGHLQSLDSALLEKMAAMNEARGQIRAIRTSLTSPGGTPSASHIRRQIRLEERVESWTELETDASIQLARLREIAYRYLAALAERDRLKQIDFDDSDKAKINSWTHEFRRQLMLFGFSSAPIDRIQISADTFRPTILLPNEGDREREIGQLVSASDFIRLKWAYLLSLAVIGSGHTTNHIGLLIVDEPGQQEVKVDGYEAFVRAAAQAAGKATQIVIATSAELSVVERAIDGLSVTVMNFNERLLKKIG